MPEVSKIKELDHKCLLTGKIKFHIAPVITPITPAVNNDFNLEDADVF